MNLHHIRHNPYSKCKIPAERTFSIPRVYEFSVNASLCLNQWSSLKAEFLHNLLLASDNDIGVAEFAGFLLALARIQSATSFAKMILSSLGSACTVLQSV